MPTLSKSFPCLALAAAVVSAVAWGAGGVNSAQEPAPPKYPNHSDLMVWIDDAGTSHPVKTREDWEKRRGHVLLGMQEAMGPLPARNGLPAVSFRVTATLQGNGYTQQTVWLRAEPDGDEIPAFYYVPDGLREGEKRPAMLALHQTHALGKGDVDNLGGNPNLAYAKELAQRGYVVLAPDYPSFGDLKDYDFAADRYASGTMKGVVNHMRCVDFLASRAEVDAERIGVIGHSLGGHNAMFVAAFDRRLKVVVSSCGWTPFHDYYGGKIAGWTSDRYMPRLRDVYGLDADKVPFDFYEVVAALAPRPFFSNSPVRDDNFDVAGVRKATAEAKKVYQLFDAEEKLRVVHPDSGHDFPPDVRREAYGFIDAALKKSPPAEPGVEGGVKGGQDFAAELPRVAARTPEEAAKAIRLLDGFHVELAAAEPLVASPVAMAFDENGRLYVVEMRDYSEHGEEKLGRVRLLEDVDGDGKFDKAETFAEGLSWPTAVICWDGGVFVGAAPDILYLKDTDGDGKADVRKTVFTGFGRANVQGLMNSFLWGLDNRIYGSTSSSGGQVRRAELPDAPLKNLNGRDFAFDPHTLWLKPVTGGGQHGMSFDDWGVRFVSANSDHLQMIVYEDRYAERPGAAAMGPARVSIAADGPQAEVFRISPVEPWRVVRTRLRVSGEVPGIIEGGGRAAGYFTGATGVTIYRGDAWPAEYRGQAFIADVGSNLIHRKVLEPDGVLFKGKRVDAGREFLASEDVWFRPVQMANGPDGNLWVIDMCREVIEHPASLPPVIKKHLDLDSGRERGRIWRIVRDGSKPRGKVQLGKATTAQLVELLAHPNAWHRETASRLLNERPDLGSVEPLRKMAKEGDPLGRLHAMYVLHGMGLAESETFVATWDKNPRLREHAVKLAEESVNHSHHMCLGLYAMAGDADTRVAYQVALSLGGIQDDPGREAALVKLIKHDNAHVRGAAIGSIGGRVEKIVVLLLADKGATGTPAGRAVIRDVSRGLLAEELVRLAERLARVKPDTVAAVLRGVRAGGRQVPTDEKLLAGVLSWAIGAARDESLAEETRNEAVAALELFTFDEAGPALDSLLHPRNPVAVQKAAAESLGAITDARVADALLKALASVSPAATPAVFESLLSRPQRVAALLDAVESGTVPRATLAAEHRARLRAYPDAALKSRAEKLLAVASDRAALITRYRDEMANLKGDAARGREIFTATCAACHKIGDVGFEVGPSLGAFAARGPEAIVSNVLDPSGEVNPQYVVAIVTTTDGRVLSGMVTSETAGAITLTSGASAVQTLPRNQIASIQRTGQSLMPAGLEAAVSPQAMVDLIEYLASLK